MGDPVLHNSYQGSVSAIDKDADSSAPNQLDGIDADGTIGRPSVSGEQPFEDSTLDPAHPREWYAVIISYSGRLYKQLLGLNPFQTSYLGLYLLLDSQWDKVLAASAVLFAIAAGFPLPLIGVVFGKLINNFPPPEDELRTRIAQLLGIAAAYFTLTALYATLFGFIGEKIALRSRLRLFDCLLHLDQAYLDTHSVDFNGLLTEKIDSIHAGTSEKAGIFIQTLSYFVAAFVVGFILSPKLAGILLAAVFPLLALTVTVTSRYGKRFSCRAAEHAEAANSIVESALRAVKTVQAFAMTNSVCETHSNHLRRKLEASIRHALIAATQVGVIYFIVYSVNGLAFYLGSNMAASGQESGNAGTVFAVVFLILDSSLVVTQFAPLLVVFANAAAAQETICTLADASTKKEAPSLTKSIPNTSHGIGVYLEDVEFAYPARPDIDALRHLSLSINPGTFNAFVGLSGGGKSTLVSLLSSVYSYRGSIRLGSEELRCLDKQKLRAQMAVVEQESVLFSGTVHDNICHGLRHQDLSDAEKACRVQQAISDANLDFIATLPKGVDTSLSDDVELSGGQRQRICLARALARRPALLVLDEPTSALDAYSEGLIVAAAKRAAASGTTVIMIAHRLSTVLDVDHVFVLGEGRVIESGPPSQLAESKGVFHSLLEAQGADVSRNEDSHGKEDARYAKSLACSTASLSDTEKAEDDFTNPTEQIQGSQSSRSHALRAMLAHMKPEGWLIMLGILASFISGGLLLGEAIIFGNLVELLNRSFTAPSFEKEAHFYCLMFFVVGCIALVSWIGSGTAFGIASSRSIGRMQRRLFGQMLSFDMAWFAEPGRGVHDLMGAFTKDTGDLSCLSGTALGTIVTTTTSMVGGMILALAVAWKIAIVLMAAVPVMLGAGFLRIRMLVSADTRRRQAYQSATCLAAEACTKRKTVTLYSLEGYMQQEYRAALHRPLKNARLFTVWSNILLAASFAITYFVYALAYWWGARLVRNGEYTEKAFFTVLPALLFSAQSSGQLFSLSPEIARAKAAATSVFKLLSYEPHILADQKSSGPVPGSFASTSSLSLEEKTGTNPKIAFHEVSFTYPGGDKPALRSLSLDIHKGSFVGLVGPSGAGKSSTLTLIERFYDPSSGGIAVDGVDLRNMDAQQLRDRVGLVSQEPDLLPGSIAYNIRLGATQDQQVSDTEIAEVCRQCGLHEFITSLPEAYNTECGSGASSKLSGGQKQRVALARALIRDPEILLLDESTSALDAHSEQLIQRTLAEASTGRTTVAVAHRLATIKHADRIYVFDDGQVVEHGTHAELVELGGLYASMAKAQSLV
ncbi:hypothetical protein BAUCODRAFT_77161 [Baudoinia panamericana UAMH 10762]|uniref:ABC transporter n=1 Tax=Baudoinia panamericana (strain UAMH 10762) TaxID=717646 RepID=M2M894_BAUPA|nr:uncharacterized protein BAUCODRAFT_77161 [Baudoinia panamericana UAMH 10762]EMC92576.1 hypothetical protein BAUCODRAFT_77161 [Baudoinia panamericana UAMH 10762]